MEKAPAGGELHALIRCVPRSETLRRHGRRVPKNRAIALVIGMAGTWAALKGDARSHWRS
jgi:hypothetical protein